MLGVGSGTHFLRRGGSDGDDVDDGDGVGESGDDDDGDDDDDDVDCARAGVALVLFCVMKLYRNANTVLAVSVSAMGACAPGAGLRV